MNAFARLLLLASALPVMLPIAPAHAGGALVLDRAVLVMRHGIRAPLAEEVPPGTRTAAPWPRWPVAESRITPHGARALQIVAAADRAHLARLGLLAEGGCPAAGAVRIRTNSSDRTIASGEEYASGFAPGCGLAIEHRPVGVADPVFEPLRARATRFDGKAAVEDIKRNTGGMAALVECHHTELRLLDRVLGCAPEPGGCVPAGRPNAAASGDGHDLILSGPIRATSGIAQVLLLQYVEGMPANMVGWGRADAKVLRRLGRLHAALFAVFTRPPVMAAHQAAILGREVLNALKATARPGVEIFMGHDTNVTALAAALDIDLKAPGYATNDVPPGGALLLERLHDTRSGAAYVRVSYRTQTPDTLRALKAQTTVAAMRIPGCGTKLCPADRFATLLRRRLRPAG